MRTIQMVRGDRFRLSVKIVDEFGADFMMRANDKLFFTVKKNFSSESFVFQKTYPYSIIYDVVNERYYFDIMPNDTDNLPYGNYVFDIQLNMGLEMVKKTFLVGKLRLLPEVTFAANEA